MNNRILIPLLSLLFPLTAMARIDFSLFHNGNFVPTNFNVCGIHVEMSGNRMVVTNTIPANSHGTDCSGYDNCQGQSFALTCDRQTGECKNRFGKVTMLLLEDGNFLSYNNNTKFIYENSDQFFTCIVR